MSDILKSTSTNVVNYEVTLGPSQMVYFQVGMRQSLCLKPIYTAIVNAILDH